MGSQPWRGQWLEPLSPQADITTSIHRNVPLPTNLSLSTASPLQLSTFSIKAEEVHFIAHFTLRNQTENRCFRKDASYEVGYNGDKKPTWNPGLGSCRFRAMSGGMDALQRKITFT